MYVLPGRVVAGLVGWVELVRTVELIGRRPLAVLSLSVPRSVAVSGVGYLTMVGEYAIALHPADGALLTDLVRGSCSCDAVARGLLRRELRPSPFPA